MKRVGSRTVYEGPIASVRIDTFAFEDGEEADRQVVTHPGAVAIVACDKEVVHLVRQPREVVGEESLLELPAGKLDVEGETPLECAKRELAEESSLAAREWRELKRFYTSPGFAEEEVIVYLATGLEAAEGEPDPGERVEAVVWPLSELDAAIEGCRDSKSLVGLYMLLQMREGSEG